MSNIHISKDFGHTGKQAAIYTYARSEFYV